MARPYVAKTEGQVKVLFWRLGNILVWGGRRGAVACSWLRGHSTSFELTPPQSPSVVRITWLLKVIMRMIFCRVGWGTSISLGLSLLMIMIMNVIENMMGGASLRQQWYEQKKREIVTATKSFDDADVHEHWTTHHPSTNSPTIHPSIKLSNHQTNQSS